MTTTTLSSSVITFKTVNPALSVRCLLGDGIPTISGGDPQWSEIGRPRKKSLVNFAGFNVLRLTIPLLFDGFSEPNLYADNRLPNNQVDIAPFVATLYRMAESVVNGYRPPVVQIIGKVPQASRTWMISQLTWGESLYTSDQRVLVRQAITVEFVNNIGTPELSQLANKLRGQADFGSKGNLYTVKAGDTLRSVAAHVFNDPEMWRDLGLANGIRDPRVKLTPGRKLKLPLTTANSGNH